MIKIITDTSAYLKKSDAEEMDVKVIPITYTVGNKLYYESYADDNDNFEELFNSKLKLATSQPNPAAFLNAFEEELAQDNEVICLTLSSRLSGTHRSACMAAEQTESENIFVFDSQLAAGGLFLLISETKKLIDHGQTFAQIVKELPKIRDRISVTFSVDDMTPLRNSGRIGFVRMSVGTILNIKPILQCKDGGVVFDSVARGNNEIIKKLAAKIPPDVEEAVINYIANNRTAPNLYNIVKEKFPNIKIRFSKMGPVLGVH
ncbi:MAG: DegV family protein, partial [Clostridia bacterium]|nr:DegV family protein [Clostridia bacterium]